MLFPAAPFFLRALTFQVEAEGRHPLKLPSIHKRGPPEGTHMDNDLGTIMQMAELTANDKATLWSNYQKAMVGTFDILANV